MHNIESHLFMFITKRILTFEKKNYNSLITFAKSVRNAVN